MVEGAPSAAETGSAGARWVERFLVPHLRQHFGTRGSGLACLQIDPDDEDEAERLRREGHTCDVILSDAARLRELRWVVAPVVGDPGRLPVADASWDFILTGRLGAIAPDRARRERFARELARICRLGGAFLTAVGNRRCPVDLTGNAPRLHGPASPTLVTLAEAEELFGRAGFRRVRPLSVAGHFGFRRLRGPARLVGSALDAYWRSCATPGRRRWYTGVLNPVLMLWVER
jgi:SAM-dependent methyltransferase